MTGQPNGVAGPGRTDRGAVDKNHRSTPRALKPKSPLAVASLLVSQLTCLLLLGIDRRRYLELLVPLCRGHVTRLGKLRLIPLDVALAKLGELAIDADDEPANDSSDAAEHDRQPETLTEVLAAWNLELAR